MSRQCMACGELFNPFLGTERVCGPRCAGDLARREHVDLRLDTYRKGSAVERPATPLAIVRPSVASALAETRAAVDMLNAGGVQRVRNNGVTGDAAGIPGKFRGTGAGTR